MKMERHTGKNGCKAVRREEENVEHVKSKNQQGRREKKEN